MRRNTQIWKCIFWNNQQSKPIDLAYARFTQDNTARIIPLMALANISSSYTEMAGVLSILKAWGAGGARGGAEMLSSCWPPWQFEPFCFNFNAFLFAPLVQTGFLSALDFYLHTRSSQDVFAQRWGEKIQHS